MPSLRSMSTVRAGALVLFAALLLQLAFAGSYVGAFHEPTPHQLPVAVVAPGALGKKTVERLDQLPGRPLDARLVASHEQAKREVEDRELYGIYLVDRDRLYVASAANKAAATALEAVFAKVRAADGKPPLAIKELAPLPAHDPNGLAGFYAVIAWVFGGYLAATLLGLVASQRSRSRRLALVRLGGLGIYAIVAGLISVLVLKAAFGVLGGHLLAVWAIAALAIFASGAATVGLQALGGMAGTAVAIVLFVIIGNAASGGAYARPLLPGFWSTVGGVLPPGAAVDLVRNTLFFDGARTLGAWLVLAGWAITGSLVAVALGGRSVDPATVEAEASVAAAI